MSTPNIGRFDFADGGFYLGASNDGVADGLGVYAGPEGKNEYAGSWRGGFEECGVHRWSRGNYYEGQWLQGRRHGLGVESQDGWLYKGEWTQGLKGRYGLRQSTKSGAKYEGSWTFGHQDGYGVETYADGGTYQGQWLRGMRHGYGLRQSVSYDLALRYYHISTPSSSSPHRPPSTPLGHDPLLDSRDQRMEQGLPGGFVLQTDTYQSGRRSWSSIRGALKFIRQRSMGDIEDPHRSNAAVRSQGGSLRSTTSSTGRGTLRSQKGPEEHGSFLSVVDAVFQDDVVEKYWGEWKNDQRSGYGVCERTDGAKYEGEWLENKKNGYGVTTLRDGTRIEGKYKKNVLLTSTADAKKFSIRTNRLKEQVENAVKEAEKAARTAKEKAEIANSRTTSARVKADQAQVEGQRAEIFANEATTQAQKFATNVAQPGVQIFMNRLKEEDFLSPAHEGELDTSQVTSQPTPKFLSLFRQKKPSRDRRFLMDIDIETPLTQNHNTAKFYSVVDKSEGHRACAEFRGQAGSSTERGIQDGDVLKEKHRELFATKEARESERSRVNLEVRSKPEVVMPQVKQKDWKLGGGKGGGKGGGGGLHDISFLAKESVHIAKLAYRPPDEKRVATTLPTFTHLRVASQMENEFALAQGHSPARRRAQGQIEIALPPLGPVDSTMDPVQDGINPSHFERRKSLPSIVKDGIPSKPETKSIRTQTSLIRPEVVHGSPATFVIEDGVRKRVTPVYGPKSPVRTLAVEGRAGLPKLYQIESTTEGHGRGSVPDVSNVSNSEVLPRETVHAMSQRRREEMAREREESKRSGEIILRLGDMTEWCARRKMLIIMLAVNYALVTVFYNMLQQQAS